MVQLTSLNFAILGLLNRRSQTGYELMQVFETTPLGGYSSSPGAIYPALRKLKRGGFVTTAGEGASGRGEALAITGHGTATLKAWLAEPPVAGTGGGIDLSVQMLKFTFTGDLLTKRQQQAFIDRLESAVNDAKEQLAASREQLRGNLNTHDLLAVEAGLLQYRAAADWCALARKTLSKGK